MQLVRDDAFGQAVYSKVPFTGPERAFPRGQWRDPQFRVQVQFAGASVTLMDIHVLPPLSMSYFTEQRRETAALAALAQEEISMLGPGDAFIIAGDLNATRESGHLAALRRAGLRLAQDEAGSWRGATWPRTGGLLPLLPGVRIDHVLFAGGLECVESGVCGDTGSDHRPTFARFVPRKP